MVGFRIPGPLSESNATTGRSQAGCVAGFPPRPLGLTAGRVRSKPGDMGGPEKPEAPLQHGVEHALA